jgi:hypothetical protein
MTMSFNTCSPPADLGIDAATAGRALRRYFWTTKEDSILREWYCREGAEAALARLPGRTWRGVCARAFALGLGSVSKQGGDTSRKAYAQDDRIDEQLRVHLPLCTEKGSLEALANAVNRPAWWVYRRAVALGLVYPRRCREPWAAQEDAILAAAPHLGTRTLQARLKRAGYKRSEIAIAVRLRRLQLSRVEPDTFTTGEVALMMGVSQSTVRGWIRREGLRASTTPDSQAETPIYRVRAPHLKAWIHSHAQLVDLRRVERFTFLDLLCTTKGR